MRLLLAVAIVFAVQVVGAPAVRSISTRTDVTPDNVGKQPLGLRVESEAHDDGTVRFDVFVSSG